MKLGSVLKKIIQDKKKLIEEKKGILTLNELIEKTSSIEKPTNFLDIFQKEEVALIAEIKRSSASAGDILPQLDINEITNLYVNSGVSAISILTEKTRFSGSIEDLKNVSTICKNKNIPVLQKDFIFDIYQLHEGALNGASAALVIVSILDEKEFQYLYEDNNNFIFMDKQTFEQIELGSDILTENQSKFLIENSDVIINFYNEKPVGIDLPDSVELTVLETEGVVKGQTAASSYKPATLEKNIKTSVPQFIAVNDKIVISTIDGSYIEKSKN